MESIFCNSCGAQLEEGKGFCTECGTPVQVADIESAEDKVPVLASATSAQSSEPIHQAPAVSAQPAYQPAVSPVQQLTSSQPTHQQAASQQTYKQPMSQQQAVYSQPLTAVDVPPPKGSQYAVITTGGYFGIMLLMMIPIVNIIFLIVWACGNCKKVNKRNLARATIIMTVIGLVLGLIFYFVGASIIESLM
ncbi:MAG: zinc-ribbon domain-containing protein [Clostridia bacterium]